MEFTAQGAAAPRHVERTDTRKWSQQEIQAVKEWITTELERGGLEEVQTLPKMVTPVFPIEKKQAGKWRIVHNLKALNE